MVKYLFSVGILFLLLAAGCKEKQAVKPTPEPVQPAVGDTMAVDTIAEVEEVVPEPPKPENRYFLIAASFKNEANADNYKSKLIEQGYDAEVIIRQTGANQDFFKVSFKGFSDKAQAFGELRNEMRNGAFQDVWLLIK